MGNNCKSDDFLYMKLRDFFAGQALIGISCYKTTVSDDEVAKICYSLADVMLRAREQ